MTQVTKDTIIADILEMDIAVDAIPLLESIGMHCMGCVMANKETLDEACQAHNVDTNELLAKLNALKQ
ncbi:MAG: DUF1858 domain-containing protein [Oscillospiraceae bacterium]|nr:DUF1858 domain-containing protein [Oscillospiraceae bacterium]